MKFKPPKKNNLTQHYQPMETAAFSVVQQKLGFTYETDGKEKLVFSPEKKMKLYFKHCSSLADGL